MDQHLAGLRIGHAAHDQFPTGCTVILCPEKTVASVDVRGPAPGSRETAILGLDKPLEYIHAVLLTGGSAFGLGAADGVVKYLSEGGIGHWTPIKPVPIVPAAVVFDLFMTGGEVFPDAAMGYRACEMASADAIPQGNVGAGTGVTVGKWAGLSGQMMKSGFGLASFRRDELVVGAAAVVNAVGDVVNADASVLAGARDNKSGDWLVEQDPFRCFPEMDNLVEGTNTTLVIVYTNARLDKILANRLAQRAHDGLAIAIRPVHTSHDGDTAFALGTGQIEEGFDTIANIAVEMVTEAIRNAVRHSTSMGPIAGLAG